MTTPAVSAETLAAARLVLNQMGIFPADRVAVGLFRSATGGRLRR